MTGRLPLKRLAEVSLGKMLQSEPREPSDVQQFYLRAANVQPDGVLAVADAKTMWFSAPEVRALDVCSGDVVVVEGGVGGFGRAAFVREDLKGWAYQNSINRLRPVDGVDGRFLTYALLSLRASGWIRAYCNIVSMPHLTADKLKELRVPAPDLDAQCAVADYLDHETARIDELIAEQQALVSASLERRQAVVLRLLEAATAQTDGRRLKHVVERVRQGWSPQCESFPADGVTEWGVLKTGCVNRGVFRPTENKRLPEDIAPRTVTAVRAGEIIVARASTRDLVGSAAVSTGEHPRLMLSDKLYSIRMDPRVAEPEFVALRLGTRPMRDLIELEASGASYSMQNISQSDILNLPMPLPSVEDQSRVLSEIQSQVSSIDSLIDNCRELVVLLRERRAALITAAVTGQIDVRSEVDTPVPEPTDRINIAR